jgi:hypothetical protein
MAKAGRAKAANPVERPGMRRFPGRRYPDIRACGDKRVDYRLPGDFL